MSFSEEDREKWRKTLVTEMISSDDSESEDGKAVLFVKELPWRSDKVSKFFKKLDDNHRARRSEQAARQTKPRLHRGVLSSRQPPVKEQVPAWAIVSHQ